MLSLYRRHLKSGFGTAQNEPCPASGSRGSMKSCQCPVWIVGVDPAGKYHRKSLHTDKWTVAEKHLQHMLLPPAPVPVGPPKEEKTRTFEQARDLFIAKLEGEGREVDTIRKYRLLFGQMENYANGRLPFITDWTYEELIAFRGAWGEAGVNTRNKKLDRLKAFFRATHEAGLIVRNPAQTIKPTKAAHVKVQPFSRDEQKKILAKPQITRTRAFVHTLYQTGLRISDCCFLKPTDFNGNNLSRVNRKNGVEIFVPIPPTLKADLDALQLSGGYYFLIGESENLHTQTDAWRTLLNDLYKKAVHNFHVHRFRHTRVVEWLAHGLTFEEIAGMIGTSVKVLEKHYASFAPARRQVVSEKLERMWGAKPKLVRVK